MRKILIDGIFIAVVLIFSGFASVAPVSCTAKPDYTTLIAHRGESFDTPENTLIAYKTAVERGFGFECDIYLSKDNRVFTFHDRTLTRTTGGANTNHCHDVNWDEISRLDVGSWGKWKGSKFAGTRPALLEEVLDLAVDGRYIYVEIKTGPEIVPFVKEIIAKKKNVTPKNVLFISFNLNSCEALKKQMPEYKVYWLSSLHRRVVPKAANAKARYVPIKQSEIIKSLKSSNVDGLDFAYNEKLTTAEYIAAIKKEGFECHAWTIDNIDVAVQAFNRGVQTITTNRAKDLLEAYKAK
jgi:glycerophosphoryl diester phosphodiesterase